MYELVYKSTVKTKLSDEALKSILEKSRDFNAKNNITGCLIYYNNSFLNQNYLDYCSLIETLRK